MGVTPNYLSRIFKSITGDTCVSFLGKVRLDEAKKLLRDSSFKSYEVAEAVGYKNPNYFGAMFKRYTGYTPKEYRRLRMKIRIKSVKSKIIVFFIGLAAFQICVMAGFAKLQLEPSIVSMYSEHLERFADVALTETTQETEKIERYMVNIIGDAQIQDFLRRADEEQSAELPPVLSTELRNRILSYTDYDNIITAIYLVDNYGRIYSNLGKSPMQTFMNRNQELKDRKEESAVWYGGENGNTITVYRNVNNNTTDLTQKIGALCIFIDRKMFQERIDDLMMEEEQHYVLENEERHLKISSDQDETEERDSIVVMRTDGRWGLRTWIEKDIIYRPVKMMMRILLAELFALLLVSIALVVFLSERITRPIRKLTIAMKEIGAGNIDTGGIR